VQLVKCKSKDKLLICINSAEHKEYFHSGDKCRHFARFLKVYIFAPMTNRHINLLLPLAALLWIGFFYGCRAAQPAEPDVRVMRYYPDGRDFVCLNGEGRYNRPLNGPVW
jgi:hypothetical protein